MTKPPAKLTRAEQKARRPQEILDAAFEEFLEKGFVATRVEDVANRLNLTKGTIYLYFPSKEALFEAMIRHVSEPFVELRKATAALTGTPMQRLRQLITVAYQVTVNQRRCRELLRLVVGEGHRFPDIVERHYDEFVAPLMQAVCSIIEDGVAAGQFRAGAATAIPDIFICPIMHFNLWDLMYSDRRPLPQEAFIEAHVDMVVATLTIPLAPGEAPLR